MKRYYLLSWLILALGCRSISNPDVPKDWHLLDVEKFTISVPPTWSYQPRQGEDSFIGQIDGPNVKLFFDCSSMGYASNLISDQNEQQGLYNTASDREGDYIIEILWPKTPEHGMTGIYIHSKTSTFNFQMNGNNLSAKDEDAALKAFKTITFKL